MCPPCAERYCVKPAAWLTADSSYHFSPLPPAPCNSLQLTAVTFACRGPLLPLAAQHASALSIPMRGVGGSLVCSFGPLGEIKCAHHHQDKWAKHSATWDKCSLASFNSAGLSVASQCWWAGKPGLPLVRGWPIPPLSCSVGAPGPGAKDKWSIHQAPQSPVRNTHVTTQSCLSLNTDCGSLR